MRQKGKVLVVDDDVDFRASVRFLLESHEIAVIEADSGKEGLRKVVEHHPDLIVLDIMMESCTEGYGVNQAIKYQDAYAEYRSTPIIMVSSIQETPDQLFLRAPEVEMIRPDLYIAKPLDIPKFLELVESTLAARHPLAAETADRP